MKISFGPKTIVFPSPVWCIGSYDSKGNPNIMTVAWGGICCSKPPCVTISLREATYTYGNIMEKMAYTVNVPSETYIRQADYFGIASGRETDKFKISGLTPKKSEVVDAPYVDEFPVVLECKVIHHHKIGLHTQFIGEVLDAKIEQDALTEDVKPDIEKVRPAIFCPSGRKYYNMGEFIGNAFEIGKAG